MDMFHSQKPSDQLFNSPAFFNMNSIASIHFACTLVVARSGKISGQEQPFVKSMHEIWILLVSEDKIYALCLLSRTGEKKNQVRVRFFLPAYKTLKHRDSFGKEKKSFIFW